MREGYTHSEETKEKMRQAHLRRAAQGAKAPMRTKVCPCGATFIPNSGSQMKCDPCSGLKLKPRREIGVMTVRCALCPWSAEGQGREVMDAQRAHAERAHGITNERRHELRSSRR